MLFYRIFPNAQSLLSLLQLVKKLQDEEELFRSPVDERGNRKLARINNSFPRERLVQHFKQGWLWYRDRSFYSLIVWCFSVDLNQFDRIDRNQMLIYIRKAVLKRSSYGVLVHNSKKEVGVFWLPPGFVEKWNFSLLILRSSLYKNSMAIGLLQEDTEKSKTAISLKRSEKQWYAISMKRFA